jgi:hypothetical protein
MEWTGNVDSVSDRFVEPPPVKALVQSLPPEEQKVFGHSDQAKEIPQEQLEMFAKEEQEFVLTEQQRLLVGDLSDGYSAFR